MIASAPMMTQAWDQVAHVDSFPVDDSITPKAFAPSGLSRFIAGVDGNASALCLDRELVAAPVHGARLMAFLEIACEDDRDRDFRFDLAEICFEIHIQR